MLVYSSSLLEEDHTVSAASREEQFNPVLDAMLEPALSMCEKMGKMRSSEWDRAILGINCYETVITVLEAFAFTERRREMLEEKEAEFAEQLTAEHVRRHLLPSFEKVNMLKIFSRTVFASAPRVRSGTDIDRSKDKGGISAFSNVLMLNQPATNSNPNIRN